MVQKLQANAYLKRYDNMEAGERRSYEERVGEWMRCGAPVLDCKADEPGARLQNIMQVSTGWNDQECQAFEQGAVLLSALVGTADTWLPDMLYVKSAKRAVRRMSEALETAFVDDRVKDADMTVKPVGFKAKEEPAEGTGKATQAVTGKTAAVQVKDGGATTAGKTGAEKPSDVTQADTADDGKPADGPFPVRPKHIDQYVHLLPQKTQERAAQVKDLLRGLDEAREKMRLLADDETAKDTDREAWAKKATSIDNKVRRIYDELDAEWARLVKSGRVVVDDLGNARVVEVTEDAGTTTEPDKQELTSEQKARRRELRKWLVDTRRGNGDSREEHVRKWKENFSEFLSLEGDAAFGDEKVNAAAGHYGIDMEELKK